MKMPIVSLNNMAMNESVAATCCFSATNINGHAYETVLNGGYVTDKIGNKITYSVDKSWLTIPGDYQEAVDGLKLTQGYINGAWVLGAAGDGTFTKLADCTWVAAGNQAFYEENLTNCDHAGEYCHYISTIEPTFTKVHVGATVEHAAAKDWAGTHAAIRFNS